MLSFDGRYPSGSRRGFVVLSSVGARPAEAGQALGPDGGEEEEALSARDISRTTGAPLPAPRGFVVRIPEGLGDFVSCIRPDQDGLGY